jgi:thioester reductase-like protein
MALSEAMRLNKSRSLLSATQSKRRLISRNIRLPRSTDTPIQRLNTTLTKVYNQQYEHAALDLIPFAKQLTFLCQDPSLEKAPVVALLAGSSFETILTFLALNRLGYAALFLSTRLNASAYARLMEMADCHKLIIHESFRQVANDIETERQGCSSVALLQRVDWHDQPVINSITRPTADPINEGGKIAWILHSSGSTGFPKPIFLTNRQCLANFKKSFNLRSFCTSPLFHSHALMEFGRALYTKAAMYWVNHSQPITSVNLLEAMQTVKPQMVSAVPYVLKLLAEKDEGIAALARTQLVMYAGSSCPDELGDRLVNRGVNLIANYGATETGQIMTSFRPMADKEWSYMRCWSPVADHVLFDEIAPGVFECVGLDGLPSKGPSNSKPPFSPSNPENSFRTADLFTRHPDPKKSNYYKYLSRLDDRITLVNGEKVLPIPIEGSIRQGGLVREAVVFGLQQTMPGLLVFRSEEKGLELSDEQYLDAVWPTIEAANAKAETFARVIRDLVVIKDPDCLYPKTDKGTFIRAQVYQLFAKDISGAYQKLNAEDNGSAKKAMSIPELEEWLLTKFQKDLRIPLPDKTTDIFSAGVDSLQTTRIWRAIKQELDLGSGSDSLGQNAVFEQGTVEALANHLYQLRMGGDSSKEEDETVIMEELIEKYSKFTTHFPGTTSQPEKEVVLVTGATGNLGAYIIAELVRKPSVAEVWALVRAPGQAVAGARIMQSLASSNVELSNDELAKLHALPSDLSQPDLGLSAHDLGHLLSSLTTVIHSAWAVNFNLGVRSFEQQHIRGTHNLINLCLRTHFSSPAKFFFCSSVSTASGTPKPASIAESAVENLNHAQGTGYGRSKLVTEHITRNAMLKTGMHARVLRIGQLSGDRTSAIWNDTEAIALMVRSALTVGALPALNEQPSWLPVDACAEAVAELALSGPKGTEGPSPADHDLVYHLVNPRTFNWAADFLPALKRCAALPAFDIVSPQEWLRRLAGSEQDASKNPSIKLLDFWQAKYGKAVAATDATTLPAGLTFETARTLQDCTALRDVEQPVEHGLVERYAEQWMKKWEA